MRSTVFLRPKAIEGGIKTAPMTTDASPDAHEGGNMSETRKDVIDTPVAIAADPQADGQRRRLLKASALALATAGTYGAAPFFGPWRHSHAWAQAAQKKPLVIGLTMDASGQYARQRQCQSGWAR